METTTVQLTLVSILKKITEPDYRAGLYAERANQRHRARDRPSACTLWEELDERISNENIVVADKRGETAAERMFRLRFSFKNREDDNKKPYYLVAYDDKNSGRGAAPSGRHGHCDGGRLRIWLLMQGRNDYEPWI